MSICEQKEAFKSLIAWKPNPAPTNRTITDDIKEAEILYSNAKFYYASNEFNGALVSYSCAAVLLNSIVRQLQLNSTLQKQANDILNCCLSAVQILQEKVKTSGGSSGQKDEEKKDWGKICTNL